MLKATLTPKQSSQDHLADVLSISVSHRNLKNRRGVGRVICGTLSFRCENWSSPAQTDVSRGGRRRLTRFPRWIVVYDVVFLAFSMLMILLWDSSGLSDFTSTCHLLIKICAEVGTKFACPRPHVQIPFTSCNTFPCLALMLRCSRSPQKGSNDTAALLNRKTIQIIQTELLDFCHWDVT